MITEYKISNDVILYHHLTHELVHIIDDVCDLIITMNLATSLLKKIANSDTVLYFLSCYHEPSKYVKTAIRSQQHIKLYRTAKYIYLSTANLSMSSFQELTIRLPRSTEFDIIVDNILFKLSPLPKFLIK